jgi:hypothetical protein
VAASIRRPRRLPLPTIPVATHRSASGAID